MRAWILLCFLLLSGPAQADEPTITTSVRRSANEATPSPPRTKEQKEYDKAIDSE
jgi:hypothetical protein